MLVDDADTLRSARCAELLRELARGVPGPRRALVVAGSTDDLLAGFTGWPAEVRRARRGLLLSPQGPADGDLIGVRLPRSAVGGPVTPGRGVLHLGDGAAVAVQVPRG